MGNLLPRRRVLVAFAAGLGALGAGGLVSACTGSTTPPTRSTAPPAAPDPLLGVLAERERLVEEYDAASRLHPELAGRLQPLRAQTDEQVVALRLTLALSTAGPAPTAGTTTTGATSTTTAGGVPVDSAATLAGLRAAVRASQSAAATLSETTTAERAPLVGSLAAAAACHDLLLA